MCLLFTCIVSCPHIRREITHKVQTYLSVKTLVSALTGSVSFLILTFLGVDYAVFWEFIIFILNYIPTIGSLFGVVFPAMLALVQFETFWQFLAVVIFLGGLQFLMGSILEPRLMGSNLNLSGVVIILSLAIWGLSGGLPE